MQVIIIFSAIALFSILPIVPALKCYYCISGDISRTSKSSSCGDPDSMKSADCGDSSNYVHTDYGYLPRDIALALGYTGSPASVNLDFQCAKFVISGNGEIAGEDVSYEILARGCLGALPGISTTLWDYCEKSADCYLCDTDNCNSASSVLSSLIFPILALVLTYYNV